jgi:hypothetical protein
MGLNAEVIPSQNIPSSFWGKKKKLWDFYYYFFFFNFETWYDVVFLLSLSYRKESNVIWSNFRWSDFSAKTRFEVPRA